MESGGPAFDSGMALGGSSQAGSGADAAVAGAVSNPGAACPGGERRYTRAAEPVPRMARPETRAPAPWSPGCSRAPYSSPGHRSGPPWESRRRLDHRSRRRFSRYDIGAFSRAGDRDGADRRHDGDGRRRTLPHHGGSARPWPPNHCHPSTQEGADSVRVTDGAELGDDHGGGTRDRRGGAGLEAWLHVRVRPLREHTVDRRGMGPGRWRAPYPAQPLPGRHPFRFRPRRKRGVAGSRGARAGAAPPRVVVRSTG